MKNNFRYIFPLSAVATLVSCAGSSATKEQKLIGQRPNVIFLYADDIGYGDLSCYGTSAIATPNCDKLASEGIRYLDAHCSSATSTPSRFSMLTGEYAWRHAGTGIAAGDAAMIIKEDMFTIADTITLKAVDYITKQASSEQPFFLYLATNDIHVPRVPNAKFAGKSGLGARGDALLSFDYSVGEVLRTLEELGIEENTIIILSSDNGAVLDDGYKDGAVELLGNHKPTGSLRGGKYSIYEGGTRVPCIIRWSGVIEQGESNALMSQVDWLKTFATLLDVELPEEVAIDSHNHLGAWIDSEREGRQWIIEQNANSNLAISDGRWKYIPANDGAAINPNTKIELGNSKEIQLYDLHSDIGERHNVAGSNPEIVAKLNAKLNEIKTTN